MQGTDTDFADMDAGRETASEKRARDEKGKFAKPAEKPEEQPPKPETEAPPAEKEAEQPPKEPAPPEGPTKAKDLRTAYEGLKKKVATEYETPIIAIGTA